MRKICLTVVGLLLIMVHAFSQYTAPASGEYKSMNLKLEETNLVTTYYSQTGNHSPVTGGIGTQQLTDFANIIDLKFVKWDIFDHKHSLDFELGVDHHTAASSAYVSKTGASKTGGTRIYPSLSWTKENEAKRSSFGLGLAYSGEYNYHSLGMNMQFSKRSKDNNREFNFKTNIFLDKVTLIEPSEFQPTTSTTVNTVVITTASGGRVTTSGYSASGASSGIPTSPRNTFATSMSLSQVVNQRMQLAVIADGVAQTGYLGLPFHRVYFTDGSVHIEALPETRFKVPLGLRLNYFAGDKLIIRTYYRYYTDSWGIHAHTASIETPFKITPFISVSPFYRYYVQTAAKYFAPYMAHTAADTYYTSNYDYSAFASQTEGVNLRIAPPKGLLGTKHFSMIELRYAHYNQTTELNANNITMNLKFK